jgi:hypothetical protein
LTKNPYTAAITEQITEQTIIPENDEEFLEEIMDFKKFRMIKK